MQNIYPYLIMYEKFADACLTIKYKSMLQKTKEFYVANYDPLYPFPLNFSRESRWEIFLLMSDFHYSKHATLIV